MRISVLYAIRYVELAILIVVGTCYGFAAYQQNFMWKTEITLWTDCVSKSPLTARGHSNLGQALARQGSHNKAIPLYYKALRYSVRNSGIRQNKAYLAEVQNNLGLSLEITGNNDEAISHYSETLQLMPDFAEPHANLGNVLMKQASYDKAIAHYYKAIRMKPDLWPRIKPSLAKAHNNLGDILKRQGSYDKAIVHYSKAIRIEPGYAEARQNLQLVLRKADK